MKRIILSFGLFVLFVPFPAVSQVYLDILTAPAMSTAYRSQIKSEMGKTNSNLSAIKRGQVYLQTQLGLANDLQDKVLTGLQQVSGTMRNALTVRQIYDTSADIISEMQEAVDIAADNPEFTIFAYRSAGIFRERALELYAELAPYLTGR